MPVSVHAEEGESHRTNPAGRPAARRGCKGEEGAQARALGETERTPGHSVLLRGLQTERFQPQRLPSCLQEGKQDNWSQICFQETPAQPNTLNAKGAMKH